MKKNLVVNSYTVIAIIIKKIGKHMSASLWDLFIYYVRYTFLRFKNGRIFNIFNVYWYEIILNREVPSTEKSLLS